MRDLERELELTELEQQAAVMYMTLKVAGTSIAHQPVIYTLAEAYGTFLLLRGHESLVKAIDARIAATTLSSVLHNNPLAIMQFIQDELCERCRKKPVE